MVDRIRGEVQRIFTGEGGGRRMSQRELDAYRRQLVLLGISVAAILLVVILVGGAFYQYIYLPRQTVATVAGEEINKSEYWQYRKYELLMQINQYQQMAQFMEGQQSQQYQQLAAQASQEFQNIQDASVDPTTVNNMVNDIIVMNALDEFGIEITDSEIEDFLVRYFTGQSVDGDSEGDEGVSIDPTAEAWATATAEAQQEAAAQTPTVTEEAENEEDEATTPEADSTEEAAETPQAEGTPTPQPTPNEEEIRQTATAVEGQHQRNVLDEADISRDEFIDMVVRPEIAREEIREALGQEVPTRAEQVHAAHILVQTEEAAQVIYDQIQSGEREFDEAAEAESTDSQTAPNGGDLGWFPRGLMVEEFSEVAFNLEPDEISEPFQTEFGWHIVKVLEREEDRPVPVDVLNSLRQQAYDDWIAEQREQTEIDTGDIELPSSSPSVPGQFQPPASAPPPPPPEPTPDASDEGSGDNGDAGEQSETDDQN